jgi:WD40 repeat protein
MPSESVVRHSGAASQSRSSVVNAEPDPGEAQGDGQAGEGGGSLAGARGALGDQARTYSVAAQGAMGVQVGDRNTQIIYAYNRLTWTDGVAPAPLTSVSGMIDSPYRGLSAFEEQDAPFFFGREADAAQVLKRMSKLANEAGLLVVSGISGAGKSSLMRAGVLPRLRGIGLASMPEAASWPCLIFAPSHAPLDELAIRVGALAGTDSGTIRRSLHTDPSGFALTARQAALTQSDRRGETGNVSPPESHRLLLIIDQFEQLFTQCSDDEQRQAFITALHAAASPSGPGRAPAAMIVLAVRADFEARCAEYQQLADPIRDRFLLTSMTGRQLRMAITEPAKNAGSSVDADLAEVLLREISSQQRSPDATSRPGAIFGAGVLPLLSHALDQAWRNRAGDVLTLADYERVGGIERAIADSAQRAFNGLSRAQQAVARQVFTRLNAATLPGTALLTSDGTVALSPDGKILAVSYGGVVQLWDIANRKQLGASLKAPYGGADALAFSSDGRTLAVAGYDTGDAGNIVDLWDMATRRLEGHLAVDNLLQVNMMAFGPGAKTLAVAAIAGQAAVLDLATGRQSAVINTGQVLASAFSPDGTTLAVSGDGGVTRLWNLTTGRLAGGPLHTGVAEALAFSPDGRTLAAGGYGGTARLWDITTGKQTGPVFGNAAIQSLAFSPDGKILATGDYYGAVQLWDVATGSELCDPLTGHTGAVIWAAFSSDGKTLITNSSDGTTRLWNVTVATNDPDGGPQLFPSRVGAPVSLAFSPDGMTLAIAAYSGTVQLWDMAGGNPVSRHLDTTAATSVAFSPDGKTLAIGTWDGTVQLWSTATGRRIASVRGSVEIGSVAFSPDGKTLAAADTQGAQLWDVASRKPTWLFRIPNGPVSVAFSPDGKTLAAIASGDTVRLWQVATRKPINGPLAAATAINAIAFSPDGKTLGTGAYNGTMQLWDVATGQKDGAPFTGNTGPVEAVAFSPDGKTLATGAEDGTARLWDVATRQEIGTPFLDQSTVSSVVFSPDGKTLVTVASSSDSTTSTGTMQLWNVSYLDNVVSSLCASAGRSLTRAEWALYVQGPPYQNLCA